MQNLYPKSLKLSEYLPSFFRDQSKVVCSIQEHAGPHTLHQHISPQLPFSCNAHWLHYSDAWCAQISHNVSQCFSAAPTTRAPRTDSVIAFDVPYGDRDTQVLNKSYDGTRYRAVRCKKALKGEIELSPDKLLVDGF
jgi:hypothetical protein